MKEVQRWNDFPRSRGSQGQSGFNTHSWDSSYREHQSFKGWTAPNTASFCLYLVSDTYTSIFSKCLKYKRNLPPKKKKIHSPIPQNASVWIYLVKPWECHWYLHSPKTTENAGPEDYMCPSSSERSQEHVAQSIPLGCGLRHGVGLHQTRLNLANW